MVEQWLKCYQYQILVIGSLLCFLKVAISAILLLSKNKAMAERYRRKTISTPLRLTLYMLASLWLLHMAVDYYHIANGLCEEPTLTWLEQLLDSLFSAVDIVGVTGEFEKFILEVRAFADGVIPDHIRSADLWQMGMIVYASLLNVVAPIVGGALALEIISRSFPKARLGWLYCQFWRPKCFFSELSSASLALAKSISRKSQKAVLIFTDAYVANDDEKESELLLEAKQLGAVCVRDDLVHLTKPWWAKCEFYLMDGNEFENLRTLKKLTEKWSIRSWEESLIYLFVQTDAYVQIEKQINLDLDSEKNKKIFKRRKKPVIIPVSSYRNLVHNLFDDVPLYEPLIPKKASSQLTLTILGNGTIGTEAFLSAYWFGQMLVNMDVNGRKVLKPCDMTVNVVSTDSEKEFWSKIDYINPEIKATVQVLNGREAENSCNLFFDPGAKDKFKPYCKVRYIRSNVKTGCFWTDLSKNKDKLLNTDYYVVAIGNDEDNILVADKLRRFIGKKYLEEGENADVARKVIITCAVFDAQLAETLNKRKRYRILSETGTDIYMHAFGTMEDVYSCENICMSKRYLEAAEAGNGYRNINHRHDHIEDNVVRSEGCENGNYNYWSNLAKAFHIQYKVFSLGWIEQSLFDYDSDTVRVVVEKTADGEETCYRVYDDNKCAKQMDTDQYHRKNIRNICKKYKKVAISETKSISDRTMLKQKADLEAKKYALAWCEHRRWNAFTRTMGYQYTDGDNILKTQKTHKNMELKLHACLVEIPLCGNILPAVIHGKKRLRLAEKEKKPKVRSSKLRLKHLSESDALDRLTDLRRKILNKKNAEDFKKYDFYRCDFDDYENLDVLAESIPFKRRRLLRYSRRGKLAGAFYFEEKANWYVPLETTKRLINKSYCPLDPRKTEHQSVIEQCKAGKVKTSFLYRKEWYVKQSVLRRQLRRKKNKSKQKATAEADKASVLS